MAETGQMPIFDGTVLVPIGTAERIVDQLCAVGRAYCDPDEPDNTPEFWWIRLKQHARFCKECGYTLVIYAKASGARLPL